MKKLLLAGMAIVALGAWAQPATIPSQSIPGEAIMSISTNGEWIVSELGDGSMRIHNLITDQKWDYVSDGLDNGVSYDFSFGRGVSDDGTVVGERQSMPSYWRNGVWTALKGAVRDDSGVIRASVGAITPDGSVICGGLGRGNSEFDNDASMIYPVLWYRQADGTYGDPVWLPESLDFMSLHPQYNQCTAISDDGKTVITSMTSYTGIHFQPYVYTQNEDGSWAFKRLGMELLNPSGEPIVEYPGEYEGTHPDPAEYMTASQIAAYDRSYSAWYDEQLAAGYDEQFIEFYLQYAYAMDFMSESEKQKYLDDGFRDFMETYVPWWEKWEAYEQFIMSFDSKGMNFMRNNGFVSPDGKYAYATASSDRSSYFPVGFEVATGESFLFDKELNVIVTSVADGYNVFAQEYNEDSDWYRMGYIFPENQPEGIALPVYFEANGEEGVYDWMEENMYQSVVVGVTASGAEQFDDAWAVGKPISTPDMSIIGFGGSTLYWEFAPEGADLITFILNTGLDAEDTGVECIPSVDEEGNPVYYNLQGVRVTNPEKGIYIKSVGGQTSKIVL